MDANVHSLAGKLIRELRDKIKADVEKEVYGLTAGRGRDMKVKVDQLEAEVRQLRKANDNLGATARAKAVEELPWIENPELQQLRAENDDLRDTIASDDATRRDKKIKVDRLEAEVESLHSVIKLKDDRLTWWRQHADDQNRTIEKLRENAEKEEAAIDSTWMTSTAIRTTLHQRDRRIEELRGIISERNSTIDSLQGRLNDLDPTLPT